MFPEKRSSLEPSNKPLLWFENGRLYRVDESRVHCELDEYIMSNPSIVFTPTMTRPEIVEYTAYWSNIDKHKLIATDKGKILSARLRGARNRTSWVVAAENWDENESTVDISFLKGMTGFYKHMQVGTFPTPAAHGRATMRWVYDNNLLPYHTSLPLSCENYLHRHGYGGIVITPKDHVTYPEVTQADMASAWVSLWGNEPDETPAWFTKEVDCATYFAECIVSIPHTLALGIFPVRRADGRVVYPTRKGVYRTHIWKENVVSARRVGCDVKVLCGWSWPSFTADNQFWSSWIYNKRCRSKDEWQERKVKKVAVSAIGSNARQRVNYTVVGDSNYDPTWDYPAIDANNPINLWVHRDRDDRSPCMVHWVGHTIACCNLSVRDFAYDFASSGTLVLVDYDSVFVRSEDVKSRSIQKYTSEGINCKPGTWLWKTHHNFRVLRNRIWISDEEPGRYGSLLEGLRK